MEGTYVLSQTLSHSSGDIICNAINTGSIGMNELARPTVYVQMTAYETDSVSKQNI